MTAPDDRVAGTGTPDRPRAGRAPDLQSCSWQHESAGTAAYGTAAAAGCWVAIEQRGPWGRDAARESRLDPELGAALEAAAAGAGGRLLLIRPPGAHPEPPVRTARTVLVAHVGSAPWLMTGMVEHPAALLALDWPALAAGDQAGVARSAPYLATAEGGVLLVCTNGRRDRCCSLRARPVADAAGHARPGRVWECSHTGGHRFAPTGLVLPAGRMLARLDARTAIAVVDAAAEQRLPAAVLGPWHDRGASWLSAPAQVAESALRAALRETAWAPLPVTHVEPLGPDVGVDQHPTPPAPARPAAPDRWRIRLRHPQAGAVEVLVSGVPGTALPESCGRSPVTGRAWSAELLGPVGAELGAGR